MSVNATIHKMYLLNCSQVSTRSVPPMHVLHSIPQSLPITMTLGSMDVLSSCFWLFAGRMCKHVAGSRTSRVLCELGDEVRGAVSKHMAPLERRGGLVRGGWRYTVVENKGLKSARQPCLPTNICRAWSVDALSTVWVQRSPSWGSGQGLEWLEADGNVESDSKDGAVGTSRRTRRSLQQASRRLPIGNFAFSWRQKVHTPTFSGSDWAQVPQFPWRMEMQLWATES